nr:hypothetical protein [Actinomycetota bacterium]
AITYINEVKLSSDATAISSATASTIASKDQVGYGLPSVPPGQNVQLENPQLQPDSSNEMGAFSDSIQTDLFASYGDFRGLGDYHTVKIACDSYYGPCYDPNALLQDGNLQNYANLPNPGGMSLADLYTAGGAANFALFASGGPRPRYLYYDNAANVMENFPALNSQTSYPYANAPQPTNLLPPS